MPYPKLSGTTPIGLFLGLDTVFAVQLKLRPGSVPLVTAAARASLPAQADLTGEGRERLRETVRSVLAHPDFKGRRVHINLPHSGAVRRYVQVQKGRSSLGDVARIDLETVFPETPIEQILFAPVHVGERKISGAKIDEYVLLAAAPEFLRAISQVASALRLKVTGLGFAPEAAWWATRHIVDTEPVDEDPDDEIKKRLTAVLSPVGNAIDLSLWDGDRLAFVKLIGRETGAPTPLERMAEDVGEAMWFYLSVHRESELREIVVTGILAEYDQFKVLLEKNLDKPVRSMHYSLLVETATDVDFDGAGAWTEAIGLAVLGTLAGQGRRSELDFAPRRLAQAGTRNVPLLVGALLLLLVVGGNFAYWLLLSRELDRKRETIEDNVNACASIIQSVEAHNSRTALLQSDHVEPALERLSWVRLSPCTDPIALFTRLGLHEIDGVKVESLRVQREDPDAGDSFSLEVVVSYNQQTREGKADLQRLYGEMRSRLVRLEGFDIDKDWELDSIGESDRFRNVLHWRVDRWL